MCSGCLSRVHWLCSRLRQLDTFLDPQAFLRLFFRGWHQLAEVDLADAATVGAGQPCFVSCRYLASIPKNQHRRLLHVVHHGLEPLGVGLRFGHSRAGFGDGFEETERITLFTDPGEVVIDPCAGSGSTIIAASRCDRTGFGFEIKKDFHKAACDWLKREKSQMKFML